MSIKALNFAATYSPFSVCLNLVFDDENYSLFVETRNGKKVMASAIKPLCVTQ